MKLSVLMAVALVCGTAYAQDRQTDIARRDLLVQAETARRTGHFAEALDSATRAGQIRMTPSIRLLLAQAHMALGHILSALDESRACTREAELDTGLRNRDVIISSCQEISAHMEPRVGRITVRMDTPLPTGLRLRIGETELNTALIGVPTPVMPGVIAIHAEADGYHAFDSSVTVRLGGRAELTIQMEREHGPSVVNPHPQGLHAVVNDSSGPGAAPWVLVGIGGAAAVTGAILLGNANSYGTERDMACGGRGNQNDPCESIAAYYRAYAIEGDRLTPYRSGVVTLGIGSAAIAIGLLWYLLTPSHSHAESARAYLMPVGNGVMFGFRGSL